MTKTPKTVICIQCGEPFEPEFQMFRSHSGNSSLCGACDRENFEDSIGYEND